MAAPQTHFVVAFGFRAIFYFLFGWTFSTWQLGLIYFWGAGMDIPDHFKKWDYVKHLFTIRIKRFIEGGGIDSPSKEAEAGMPWFHIWTGAFLARFCGIAFFPSELSWIPIFFWFTHVIVDEYQKNDRSYPNYSFLEEKDWEEKEGYPIKPRMEIIISTALSALIIVVELYFQFFS